MTWSTSGIRRPAARRGRGRRAGALLASLTFAAALSSCDILDVTNPNNMVEDELDDPQSGRALVRGAAGTVTRAIGAISAPYSTATDEVIWIGSRDAWQQLQFGNIADERNEFTDAAFPYVGEARWMADEAVARIQAYLDSGTLPDPAPMRLHLANASLYAGIMYAAIGDMFDDWAFSDRNQPAPPIFGPELIGSTV
jgi:starch-binding outer membrane protein, SusD/RagB family